MHVFDCVANALLVSLRNCSVVDFVANALFVSLHNCSIVGKP